MECSAKIGIPFSLLVVFALVLSSNSCQVVVVVQLFLFILSKNKAGAAILLE